jgi:hypothetical protein
MIIEVRIYKLRPGLRERFITFFEEKALPAQEQYGMRILGQFRSTEQEDTFVWLRAFEDETQRETQKRAFYESALWKETLEQEAFSMIEDYTNVFVVEPTAGSRLQ